MPPVLPRTAAAALLLFACGAAGAATVRSVEILGLDEAMTENVRVSLSLVDAIGKDVRGRRLGYLVRAADDETREALEPFGYYSPEITVERNRTDGGTDVVITVKPGEPVRVRDADIAIIGEGGRDRYLKQDLGKFKPNTGEVFNHALYEASKTRITRRLAERGYFDADFASHRVEVTRADNAADIDLVWTSGDRYDMGRVDFEQTPKRVVRERLLRKLIYWEEGQYYHQGRLDRLRESLVALDYFSRIDIQPHPEQAVDGRVPVQVALTPAKRDVYTAGLSYGTESGPGVRFGLERRYVNQRGHKALTQLDYAQKRKTLTLQYRIPAFAWLDGWYTASLQFADEQTDYMDNRRLEFVASRSGEINEHLTATASAHVLRERWAYTGDIENPGYRYGSFTFGQLRAEYIDVDDRVQPRAGLGGSIDLRAAPNGSKSDAGFVQARARASWFKAIGVLDRLVVRGELGHTWTDAITELPPSLRFYAGGIRSIRGYDYREVGPRIGNFGIGAKNVVTASGEYEHYFNDTWGGAVFVDSGSAFNGRTPDWHTGVGIGLRWRSPVGPLRVDIARGLNDPRSPFTVYLNIGPEL
jgi:translocation and assembly module TamA